MQIYNNFKDFVSRNSKSSEIQDKNLNIEIQNEYLDENIDKIDEFSNNRNLINIYQYKQEIGKRKIVLQ